MRINSNERSVVTRWRISVLLMRLLLIESSDRFVMNNICISWRMSSITLMWYLSRLVFIVIRGWMAFVALPLVDACLDIYGMTSCFSRSNFWGYWKMILSLGKKHFLRCNSCSTDALLSISCSAFLIIFCQIFPFLGLWFRSPKSRPIFVSNYETAPLLWRVL